MSPFWMLVLIAAAVVVIQGVVVARLARRLLQVGRRLGDRRQLGAMLAPDTREALRLAGLDPDDFGLQDLADDTELRRRIATDLRAAFLGALRGRGDLGPAAGPAAPRATGAFTRPPALPTPIDAHPDLGARYRAIAVAVVLALAILWLLWR